MMIAIAVGLVVGIATAPAEEVTKAELSVGDVAVKWTSRQGMTICYRGAIAFEPYSAEFTLHDRAWKKAFYSSTRGTSRATVGRRGRAEVIDISDDTDHFFYRKRVTVRPDGGVVEEFEYYQKDLDDAALQLGWRPWVPWLDGARYRVVAGGKRAEGEMTRGPSGKRVLWSGITELEFTSIFGTWRLRTSQPMTLYDYRGRKQFWLGWDIPLEKGKKYTARVEISFQPGCAQAGGVELSDIRWTREVSDGHFRLGYKIRRLREGPEVVALSASLQRGDRAVASRRKVLGVGPRPRDVQLDIAVADPGAYTAQVLVVGSGNEELLRLPELPVKVAKIVSAVPGLSLYTSEKRGEILVRVADTVPIKGCAVVVEGPGMPKVHQPLQARQTIIPFDAGALDNGLHTAAVELLRGKEVIGRSRVRFVKAPPAANEVKIDYRTRGLIVGGKPFFPFGFYTHNGAFYDTYTAQLLPDLEAPYKFNLICVYHNFSWERRVEFRPRIQQFLDRCEAVGMKMHYDIRHMTDAEIDKDNEAHIRDEMTAVREAPALLCWYLSDEPAGRRIPPDRYVKRYPQLKEWDPYHPTTMVFCVPAKAAEYRDGLDILMVDPYPIPNGPVTRVADVVELVRRDTFDEVPIWCVPQAFGGGEWWGREPTPAEERCMTYLAIVHGATGIQYFIRRPPWNNPFVPALWGEIRRMAAEIRQLTPVLLSHEPRPSVEIIEPGPQVHAAAWACRNRAYVIAVNTQAEPTAFAIRCSATPAENAARVVFEQRQVAVGRDGTIRDLIDGFGVRIYEYPTGPQPDLTMEGNLLHNGSFEEQTNVGYPDYYSVGQGADLAASWGTDPLEAHHGEHSLFIRCPAEGKGPSVRAYPLRLKPGSYRLSVWLKYDREGGRAKVAVSGYKGAPAKEVSVGRKWQQVAMDFQVPENTRWVHVSLRPVARGVLWADETWVQPAGERPQE